MITPNEAASTMEANKLGLGVPGVPRPPTVGLAVLLVGAVAAVVDALAAVDQLADALAVAAAECARLAVCGTGSKIQSLPWPTQAHCGM